MSKLQKHVWIFIGMNFWIQTQNQINTMIKPLNIHTSSDFEKIDTIGKIRISVKNFIRTFSEILDIKIYKNRRIDKGQPQIDSHRPENNALSVDHACQINTTFFEILY